MKQALIIGCNYIGTSQALAGCVNDAKHVETWLLNHMGFEPAHVVTMTDDNAELFQPKKVNILRELYALALATHRHVTEMVLISYAGHGTQLWDQSGDEVDQKDEVLVPSDYQTSGFITDDDLHRILGKMHSQTWVVGLFDCCHSATVLDLNYRYTIEGTEVADVSTHVRTSSITARVLIISACDDNDTAADTVGLTSVPSGALTSSILQVLADAEYHITCFDLLKRTQKFLLDHGYRQRTQLSSTQSLDAYTWFSYQGEQAPFMIRYHK